MKDPHGHGSNAGTHSAGIKKQVPTMNRAHFELIAENLRSGYNGDAGAHAARVAAAADDLAKTNPNFNRARFTAAATPGSTPVKGAKSRASSRANASLKAHRYSMAESLRTANKNISGK